MCLVFAACGNCFGSCKDRVDRLRKQGRDEELTRLQRRDKGAAGAGEGKKKVRIRNSPNDFSVRDTVSTLKFWK